MTGREELGVYRGGPFGANGEEKKERNYFLSGDVLRYLSFWD